MYAAPGDHLVVRSARLDRAVREGEIVEVHGRDGSPPYVVHWSDTGRESLLFPGPDAFVEHVERDSHLNEPPHPALAVP
jgi:hypothetical protein